MTTPKPRKPTRSLDAATLRWAANSLRWRAKKLETLAPISGMNARGILAMLDKAMTLRAIAKGFEREARAYARRSGKPRNTKPPA